MRGDCVDFVPYPSIVRLILCGVVPCLLCRGCLVGERSCVLPVCITQILSGGSLCGKSCVDAIAEIILCKGEDVELGARTSKHIMVFVFDLLSLTLSLLLCLALIDIVHIIYMLGLFVCLTCVQPRELHIAPQLLFRGIKRS